MDMIPEGGFHRPSENTLNDNYSLIPTKVGIQYLIDNK